MNLKTASLFVNSQVPALREEAEATMAAHEAREIESLCSDITPEQAGKYRAQAAKRAERKASR